jgi:hypothetical protein
VLAYEAESQIESGSCEFREPPAPSWLDRPNHRDMGDHGGMALVALADTPLASRFCSWPGRSGRRYIFSVYLSSECPAFCDAILLAAVRDDTGRRRALSIVETGPFPEPVLLRVQRDSRDYGSRLEFHLHLLAPSAAKRQSALADLTGGSA